MKELWILIAVLSVGGFFIYLSLMLISNQIEKISLQIFQLQLEAFANLKSDEKPKIKNDKIEEKIDLMERTVFEIRDYLVPPKLGTIRAEVTNLKKEARSLGIDN